MGAELADIALLSLCVSSFAVGAATIVGLPLGVWFGRRPSAWRRVIGVVACTGMALPPVVVGLVLYLLLSRVGPLGGLGWLYTPTAMILAQFILGLPFIVGIAMSAVAAVPRELHDQLRSVGATEWQANGALLREARPGLALAIATAFGRSLSEVGAVWLVGGNIEGHTRVLTTAIVLETSKGQFGLALLLGSALLSLALLVNAVILHCQGPPAP